MDISFLSEYMVPVIIGLCLCAGFVVKHWVNDVDNRIIPTMCALLGIALSVWIYWGDITPETLLSGFASGLAATGLHEAFVQFVRNN